MQTKSKIIIAFIVISVIALLIKPLSHITYVNGVSTRPITNPGKYFIINTKLACVRTAIHAFYDKYQKIPDKLSDLVEEFVPLNKTSIFFKDSNSYGNLESLKTAIDTKGLFLYFPANPLNGNVIAMTRAEYGPHGSVYYTNDSVVMVPDDQYAFLLHQLWKSTNSAAPILNLPGH